MPAILCLFSRCRSGDEGNNLLVMLNQGLTTAKDLEEHGDKRVTRRLCLSSVRYESNITRGKKERIWTESGLYVDTWQKERIWMESGLYVGTTPKGVGAE